LLDGVAAKGIDGILGATTVTTILGLFEVAPVTRSVLTDALDLGYPDYCRCGAA